MNATHSLIAALAALLAASAPAATTSSRPADIKGKTVDGDGRPLAGVTVQHYEYHLRTASRYELEERQQATSDANGNFAFQIPPASAPSQTPILLVARKPGLAAAWTQFGVTDGATVQLALGAPSFLGGKVTDENGKPLAGASVSVALAFLEIKGQGNSRMFQYLADKPGRELFHTKSSTDGSFRIEGFPTNGSAALFAEAPGKAMRVGKQEMFNADSMPCRSGQSDIQLIMDAAGVIEGKLVGSGPDAKLPIAQISAMPDGSASLFFGSRLPDPSRPDGTFRLQDLPAGSYRIQATFGPNAAAEWIAESVPATVESGQVTSGVEITAIRGSWLEVAVRASNNRQPIAEVQVTAYKDSYQAGAASGTNGLALLRLPPGDYQVIAAKEGWQQAASSGSVEGDKTNRVEIEMAPPRRLAGVVHLPDGQPAANLPFQVVGDYSMQHVARRTGPDGTFDMEWAANRFGDNNATPCLLVRDPERNLAVAHDIAADGPDTLELRLAPGLSIATRAVCQGKPVTNAVGALLFRTGNMSMYLPDLNGVTSEPGRIEIAALPPGRPYGLQVSAPGYGSKFIDLSKNAEDAKRVELDPVELKRTDRKLAGRLFDADDKPVSGAMVQIHGDGQPNSNTRTDQEGRFTFEVCDGPVHLFAQAQNQFANTSAAAGDTNLVVRLGDQSMGGGGGKAKKVEGVVTDASGHPAAGAEVRVFPLNGPNRSKTSGNGAFKLSYSLQPWQEQNGNPLLLVRDRARNLAMAQELFEDGTNVTVQLEPALTIKGSVLGPDSKPMPKAQVNLILQAGNMGGQVEDQPATVDAAGLFTFAALPNGQDYSLYASYPGYSQKHQRIDMNWDTNLIQLPPIVLRIADQVLAGQVVNANDKPVAGVHVQVSSDDQPQNYVQTDSQGRFKLKVCEGPVRLYANGPTGFAQITAEAGDTNVIVLLTDRATRGRAAVQRQGANTSALRGKPLPDLAGLGFAPNAAAPGKPLLLCLMDVQERASRRMTRLLIQQQETLTEQGVTVLAAQTVPATDESWNDWKETGTPAFSVIRLTKQSDKPQWMSGIHTLPWLILVDSDGMVVDEGFPIEQLFEKLETLK